MTLDSLLGLLADVTLVCPRIGGVSGRVESLGCFESPAISVLPVGVGVFWSSPRGPVGVGGVTTVVGPSRMSRGGVLGG
jgi:hypothetical protein